MRSRRTDRGRAGTRPGNTNVPEPGKSSVKDEPRLGRGEKTMEQMLVAGAEAFGRFGPEGVTTRHLARVAGVNIAAIQYYFGGKEGYYLAVVRHLVDRFVDPLLSLLDVPRNHEDAAAIDRASPIAPCAESGPAHRSETAARLYDLVSNLVTGILTNPQARSFAGISTREHINPTPAYDIIYEAISRLHQSITSMVARILGLPKDSPEAIVRAHAILGQVVMFRIGATTLCRRLEVEDIDEEEAENIARVVAESACRSLGLPPPSTMAERGRR